MATEIEISLCVKIAACVCGKDGLISQAEENEMFKLVSGKYPNFSFNSFNSALESFFESEDQVEDYISQITDANLRKFTLHVCKLSASADGLDVHENIALNKVELIWGTQGDE